MTTRIAFLADHPETIPTLAEWFRAHWSDYFAGRTVEDVAQDFLPEAKRHGIPIRLIAFVDGELAGTITLREQAMHDLPEYCPGLGGLYVAEPYRMQGVGAALVKAGMQVAQEQGYERVYATTVNARGILERLRWGLVRSVIENEEALWLYGCKLNR